MTGREVFQRAVALMNELDSFGTYHPDVADLEYNAPELLSIAVAELWSVDCLVRGVRPTASGYTLPRCFLRRKIRRGRSIFTSFTSPCAPQLPRCSQGESGDPSGMCTRKEGSVWQENSIFPATAFSVLITTARARKGFPRVRVPIW